MILPEGGTKLATNNPASRWPNGVVPYVIEGSFSKKLSHLRCLVHVVLLLTVT